jgi:hypothetical protein
LVCTIGSSLYELKEAKVISQQYALEQQVLIYEILVNYYPKKSYFIQLGGTYAQMEREEDYMLVLKLHTKKIFLIRKVSTRH